MKDWLRSLIVFTGVLKVALGAIVLAIGIAESEIWIIAAGSALVLLGFLQGSHADWIIDRLWIDL